MSALTADVLSRRSRESGLCLTLWSARAGMSRTEPSPVVDVAAAGGWSDISTLLKCYQHADHDTLLEVMSSPKKIMEPARAG